MEKRDYKHGKFTLATTDTDGFTYEDFVEYCKEENWDMDEDELNIPGEDSDEFWEWCREEANTNWECDLENIKHCKEYNVPVIITGHRGLWWGKPEIQPVRMESVYDAVLWCVEGVDAATVEFEDGVVNVYAYHHDGCNCFTIKALSKKGIAKNYACKQYTEYKPCDTKRLPYLYAIGI